MSLTFGAKITVREDDAIMEVISRMSKGGEVNSKVVKRMMYRYATIIDRTRPPLPEVVRDLSAVITEVDIGLLRRMGYPSREEVIQTISMSTIREEIRDKLSKYVEQINYAEYAKLIEAVEVNIGG